jgi:glycine betaine/proline transport system substrate-binding protein
MKVTVRTARRATVVASVLALALTACSGGKDEDAKKPPAPTPSSSQEECGDFRVAYDPSNGYEVSAFIIGELATSQLDCKVTYVKTTSRKAWRLVARGGADVYLDAYGSPELREELTAEGGPLTAVGNSGIRGGVDLLAPAFMGTLGLSSAQDLHDTQRIGWGSTTPAVTTVPALVQLAGSMLDFLDLGDYEVRDIDEVRGRPLGMGYLMQQPREDDNREQPNTYLVEGPRMLLGDGAGRISVQIPGSAGADCVPDLVSTTCSLEDFSYAKIANSEFTRSGSPAYSLVYNYKLEREDVSTLMELVELSGYNVGPADVASWLNTHKEVWKRWLE